MRKVRRPKGRTVFHVELKKGGHGTSLSPTLEANALGHHFRQGSNTIVNLGQDTLNEVELTSAKSDGAFIYLATRLAIGDFGNMGVVLPVLQPRVLKKKQKTDK